MIKATFKKSDGYVSCISISGHAFHSPIGTDIVCAGVSALFITIVNELSGEIVDVNSNNGQSIIIEPKRKNTILITALIHGLQSIEEQYPENIKVEVIEDENSN
ncbi:ribosomal-processing cysteine protease Prp [Enterococcus hulanensis]|uniref:Ribosomal processing cysteine protease Prp n=1 Tax=Enterococcus hulanensis TaxID=2559929 RepID=A0ABU3EZQ2_9ENTE|nr:ribosomal-processing cysteine protease Prp [Enterococcus hulanensis]MDT2600364.1 ribosomal-processing cysteine protease Prp [Enterococcus hulanensis]MDT2609898.1 ribosomal-processing cysteine protease Prp [Enterococcus hulanensis]MDT2617474.1 ribosomal-processing cysteine protease Prp [Enterococcus hulanensis]MDT2628699.1 ribosomal-processing cysteine protease Prp [Enterococcus hulanensis]MDT2656039.1 ribosomal-processing cysteine protease Prp [Enterococcus hulanensis]